ncbi:hypothetical protein HJFPF1_06307 [Paramyrothecium foliicola]|nr:hypothetical protein HJFPF1_06307 [Paramyrothecium foliicola]
MSTQDISEPITGSPCPDQPWGTIATNVPDAPTCISDCRAKFLRLLLPSNETFRRVCQILSDDGDQDKNELFWSLYCCDSQLCGVNNLWEPDQDPNVNWLINSCQNVGQYAVLDPGPPEATYICSNLADDEEELTCPSQVFLTPNVDADSLETPWASVEGFVVTEAAPTGTSVATPSRTHETLSHSTYSSLHDPSLAVNIDLPGAKDQYNQSSNVPTGIKVIIVLATLAIIALIATFILCFLRTKRKTRCNETAAAGLSKHQGSLAVRSVLDPGTADYFLVEPEGKLMVVAPPRLQDRRFLSPLPKSANEPPSTQNSRITESPGSPSQPLPLLGSIEHRALCKSTSVLPVALPTITMSSASRHDVRGHDAQGDVRDTPSPVSQTAGQGTHGSAGAEIRPPCRSLARERAERSLPGSPGPPPDRALPSTPPKSPIAAAAQGRSDVGIAVGLTPHSSSQDVLSLQNPHEICNFSVGCTCASRHSWGSWGGGGGGPGVSSPSLKKHSTETCTPLLDEMELEKMGGCY